MGRTLKGTAGAAAFILLLAGCSPESDRYRIFADFPGFAAYYAGRCAVGDPGPPGTEDRELLMRFRPRFILPSGSIRPVGFYEEYLPATVLRRFSDKAVGEGKVSREELRRQQDNTRVYLEYRPERGKQPIKTGRPVVFGRVYRERVPFPGEPGNEGKDDDQQRTDNFMFSLHVEPPKPDWHHPMPVDESNETRDPYTGLCANGKSETCYGPSYLQEISIRNREACFIWGRCQGTGGIHKAGGKRIRSPSRTGTFIPRDVTSTVLVMGPTRRP